MMVLDRNYDGGLGLSQPANNSQMLSRSEATSWRDLAEQLTPDRIDQLDEAPHSRRGRNH